MKRSKSHERNGEIDEPAERMEEQTEEEKETEVAEAKAESPVEPQEVEASD